MTLWLREGEPESMATCSFPQEPEHMPLLADLEAKEQQVTAPADTNETFGRREWSAEEFEQPRTLVEKDGVGDWEDKAEALGTGRAAASVCSKWYRDGGALSSLPLIKPPAAQSLRELLSTYRKNSGPGSTHCRSAEPHGGRRLDD